MKSREKRKYFFILSFLAVAVIFISWTLFKFYTLTHRHIYNMQIEEMKNLSMQGCAVVEKKLEGLVNLLYGLTESIEENDITSDENINHLRDFLDKHDVGFQRMGIADAEGNALITNGEMLQIDDREYFQTCMNEKHGATEIRYSDMVDKQICVVAVPILDDRGEAAGVLYGISELDFFEIYSNTVLEGKNTYIQVIDLDGNYIRKKESNLIGKKDNIFDGINSMESQISAEEIREKIQNEEQIYTEVTDGKSKKIVYFTPLKLNSWCVVSAIDFSEITKSVDYMLNHNTYIMILRIILAVSLLFLVILYYSKLERKQVKEFNEKLLLDEKVMLIAAEKSGLVIMNYAIESKELRFINRKLGDMELPKQANNLTEVFARYCPENPELSSQLEKIFKSMQKDKGKRDFLVSFLKDGKMTYLKIQLVTPIDEKGNIRQCIGMMEDYTEKQKIREKADKDPLTGLYNRNSSRERIEALRKTFGEGPDMVHAYVILDIDNFKVLNDTLGHQTGDKALQDIAEILLRHFRSYDIVGRLGGDEFIVFLKNIPREAVSRNISSLLKKLDRTYEKDGKTVQITASAGITLVSDTNIEFHEMYRRADEALYQVKKERKNGFKIYEEE